MWDRVRVNCTARASRCNGDQHEFDRALAPTLTESPSCQCTPTNPNLNLTLSVTLTLTLTLTLTVTLTLTYSLPKEAEYSGV